MMLNMIHSLTPVKLTQADSSNNISVGLILEDVNREWYWCCNGPINYEYTNKFFTHLVHIHSKALWSSNPVE